MPIYEFYSPDTHAVYTFFARRLLRDGEVPRCPDGAQHRMEKMVSRFAVTGRAKEPSGEGGGEDLDPGKEAEMMEVMREMEGMGDENPDPRQLGRMMRRMTEIAGQKLPGEFDEMVRRLEAGEDPERLEEEYGDAFGDAFGDEGEGILEGGGGRARGAASKRALRRDPVLYELADYL